MYRQPDNISEERPSATSIHAMATSSTSQTTSSMPEYLPHSFSVFVWRLITQPPSAACGTMFHNLPPFHITCDGSLFLYAYTHLGAYVDDTTILIGLQRSGYLFYLPLPPSMPISQHPRKTSPRFYFLCDQLISGYRCNVA